MALYVRVARACDLGEAQSPRQVHCLSQSRDPHEERGAFDRQSNHADVARFRDRLEDRMTCHPMATKAYKLTISLSEKEFHERGLISWQPLVREAMANLEQQWGRHLHWIAAEHMAKGHPHVHVVIKAAVVDEHGRHRQLWLDKQHLREMKREFGRAIDRDRPRDRPRERHVERPRERGLDRSIGGDTFLRLIDVALRMLVKREEQQEREYEHQRWLWRRSRERDHDRGR